MVPSDETRTPPPRPPLRLALFATVLSQCWLMIFFAFELEPASARNPALDRLGLGGALAAGALLTAGLVFCGSAINDMLDQRVDRVMAGARPDALPDRRRAVAATVLWLLIAIAGSLAFGQSSVMLTMLTVMGALFYNIAGRFIPAVGIVLLALLLVMVMLTPNPSLGFAWPLVLGFSHVVFCATADHWAAQKRPPLRWQDGWGIVLGWAFWFLAMLVGMRYRAETEAPYAGGQEAMQVLWVGPAIAAATFAVVAIWLARPSRGRTRLHRSPGNRSFAAVGLIWLNLYAVAWAASLGSVRATLTLLPALLVTLAVALHRRHIHLARP